MFADNPFLSVPFVIQMFHLKYLPGAQIQEVTERLTNRSDAQRPFLLIMWAQMILQGITSNISGVSLGCKKEVEGY